MRYRIYRALLVCAISTPLAYAGPVTYVYTGQDFSCAVGCAYQSPYIATDSIQGTLTLSAPLADNLDGSTPVTFTSFSFTDGGLFTGENPLTDQTSSHATFSFTTDASGDIIGSNFFIENPANFAFGSMSSGSGGDSTTFGEAGYGENSTQGSWSIQGHARSGPGGPPVTPEPNSLVLLGSGLLGVAGVARRRFRRV